MKQKKPTNQASDLRTTRYRNAVTRHKLLLSLLIPLSALLLSGQTSLLRLPQEIPPSPTPQTSAQQKPLATTPTAIGAPAQNNPPTPQTTLTGGVTTSSAQRLLRFTSTATRTTFLSENRLSLSDLEFIPQLNLYTTTRADLVMSPGTTLLANNRYSVQLTPLDPSYSSQWALPRIQAPTAWNHQRGEDGPLIAIIDTGFALEHEDLRDQWVLNPNERGSTTQEGMSPNCTSRAQTLDKSCNNIDDDSDGYIDNYRGWNFAYDTNTPQAGQYATTGSTTHGTLVASTAGASSNNGVGISGINWDSKLLPLQALDDTGSGSTLSVALAINYAVEHGAQIINLSLGASTGDPVMEEQINYALTNNVTVIAASGNDGCDCVSYPARYPGVISVGASTNTDTRASYSNYGASLSLLAPGNNICAAAWSQAYPSTSYSCDYSGTSLSSPLVAGAASLLLSQNRSLTPSQITTALQQSTTKPGGMQGLARTNAYGSGMLNIFGALSVVSLPTPTGLPLNTHQVKLSALSTNYLRDAMNTTCSTPVESNVCQARAINMMTNQIIELPGPSTNTLNLYWTTASAGLTPGNWIIQTRASSATASSLSFEETLLIVP